MRCLRWFCICHSALCVELRSFLPLDLLLSTSSALLCISLALAALALPLLCISSPLISLASSAVLLILMRCLRWFCICHSALCIEPGLFSNSFQCFFKLPFCLNP